MSLHQKTWTQPATHWATATPVVLDRFPKRNLSAEAIVAEGCVRAGYPRPVRVELSATSALAMPAASAFRLRKPGSLYAHARLEFAEPVRGPMLVGKERYFGLGLCLPQTDCANLK
jgi:CRISPR-associated protein Csb2